MNYVPLMNLTWNKGVKNVKLYMNISGGLGTAFEVQDAFKEDIDM